jgi:hypothetical protein
MAKVNDIDFLDDLDIDDEDVKEAPEEDASDNFGFDEFEDMPNYRDLKMLEETVGPTNAKSSVSKSQGTSQKPVKKAQAPSVSTLDDISDVTFVEFGTVISRYVFERFKAKKDIKSRICVLTSKVIPLKTHYRQGVGSFVCFEGKCCELEGYPKLRYCIPIVVYNTDNNGKPISKDLKIQILSVGDESYQNLISINEEFPITKHDIVVSCSDEKFQKLTFTPSPKEALWKKFPDAKKIVQEWTEKKDRAYECVAKKITPKAYVAALGRASSTPTLDKLENDTISDDVIDVDDAFVGDL